MCNYFAMRYGRERNILDRLSGKVTYRNIRSIREREREREYIRVLT